MIRLAELKGGVCLTDAMESYCHTSHVALSEASRIPEVNFNKELLSEWLGYRKIKLTQEYRATRDSFTY